MSVSFKIRRGEIPKRTIIAWLVENVGPAINWNNSDFIGDGWKFHALVDFEMLFEYYVVVVPSEEIKIQLLLELV